MSNSDIISNQAEIFQHITLADDLAYQHSITNYDVRNMQMVLRAYGFPFDSEAAESQIITGLTF